MTSPQTPNPEQLLKIVQRMAQVRVLLVADLVLDRFIVGRPSRISREAPVLILHQEDDILTPGGGANAAVAVAALGAKTSALGAVGIDIEGDGLLASLQASGVDTEAVQQIDGYQTPTKTRVVGHGTHAMPQQIVRFDREDSLPSDFTHPKFDPNSIDLILVSDYGYGAATPVVLDSLHNRIGSQTPVLVDSRYRLSDYSGLSGATPNQEEAERIFGHSIEDHPVEAARELRQRLNCDYLLLTRGSEGMILALEDGAAQFPVHGGSQVADVTGAGDTVIAAFGTALGAGADPLAAALIANYAGGVVVTKVGTAKVSRAELSEAIEVDPRPIERTAWTTT